jgi:hypothetical protein
VRNQKAMPAERFRVKFVPQNLRSHGHRKKSDTEIERRVYTLMRVGHGKSKQPHCKEMVYVL